MTRSELLFSAALTLVASGMAAVIGARASTHQRDSITTHTLTLVDKRNQPIAVLSSQEGGPELAFFDQQHRKRSALFLESNGTPDLYLYDAAGKTRAAFDLYDSGVPNVEFLDATEGVSRPTILLESNNEGTVRFVFHTVRENKPAKLGTFEFSLIDNRPILQLLDASGNRLWKAP